MEVQCSNHSSKAPSSKLAVVCKTVYLRVFILTFLSNLVLADEVINHCYQPLLSTIVINHCYQPLRCTIALNRCLKPLLSSVINHCYQPLLKSIDIKHCTQHQAHCYQPLHPVSNVFFWTRYKDPPRGHAAHRSHSASIDHGSVSKRRVVHTYNIYTHIYYIQGSPPGRG